MIWLTQGLTPSYKTIANFRKDNPKALQTIFKEFSILIKDLKLITGDLVAVDGGFLRANASKNTFIKRDGFYTRISLQLPWWKSRQNKKALTNVSAIIAR